MVCTKKFCVRREILRKGTLKRIYSGWEIHLILKDTRKMNIYGRGEYSGVKETLKEKITPQKILGTNAKKCCTGKILYRNKYDRLDICSRIE